MISHWQFYFHFPESQQMTSIFSMCLLASCAFNLWISTLKISLDFRVIIFISLYFKTFMLVCVKHGVYQKWSYSKTCKFNFIVIMLLKFFLFSFLSLSSFFLPLLKNSSILPCHFD